MAEEGNNSEFMAHASFLTLILPDRTAGLRRHVVHDTDHQTETATETGGGGGGGIIGTVKSYLGLDDKTTASIQDTAASASAQVTSTVAAAADSVLPESIKPEAVKGAAGGTTDGATDNATDGTTDEPADPTTDKSEDKQEAKDSTPATADDENKNDETAAGDGEDGGEKKHLTSADGKPRENPESIPTAGGQKLGEEHWGESQVVPENPKPQQEEEGTEAVGVASEAGQPTEEVKDNTAQNTGGATGGPVAPTEGSAATSPTRSANDPEKKTKFLDKLKNKLKKDKS